MFSSGGLLEEQASPDQKYNINKSLLTLSSQIQLSTTQSVFYGNKILYKNLTFFDKIFVRIFYRRRFRNGPYGEKILLIGKRFVWAWF